MSAYHYKLTCKLACGCEVERRSAIEGEEQPSGETIITELLSFLVDTADLIAHDAHTERGNEVVNIELRTMVGPLPENWPPPGTIALDS